MLLNDKEKQILYAIELDARVLPKELAETTQIPEHSIRYHVSKLTEKGIISLPRPIVDWNVLGLTHYTLFISLAQNTSKVRSAFVKLVTESSKVSWVFELGAEFNYGLTISVTSPKELSSFIHELSKLLGQAIIHRSFTMQISFCYFGRRYLDKAGKLRSPLIFSLDRKNVAIDEIDQKILHSLVNGRSKNHLELARALAVPPTTIDRRIKKLQEKNILRGFFYWIETNKLGILRYVLLINIRTMSAQFLKKLLAFAITDISITYLTECIGHWDFELGVEVFHSQNINLVVQRLHDGLGTEIQSIKVVPVMHYFKFRYIKSRNIFI